MQVLVVFTAKPKNQISENDKAVSPVSLYASTKRCNEIIAHSYSHLYNLQITGLRFLQFMEHGHRYGIFFKFVKHNKWKRNRNI